MRIRIWLFSAALGVAIAANAQSRPASVGEVVRHTVNAVAINDPSGASWRAPPLGQNQEGVNALFLTLENLDLPPGAELIVRWGDREPVRITGSGRRDIPMIGTSQAQLEVRGVPVGQPIRFKYGLTAALPRGQPFSFQNPPRFEDVALIKTGPIHTASRSVAALFWLEDGQWQVCTGFMVSARHLLTNHHCIARPDQCERVQVIFGYQMVDGSIEPGMSYACKTVVRRARLEELDLSVIELVIPKAAPPLPALHLSTKTPRVDQPLTVLQHPQGAPMKVVRLGCNVRQWPVDSPTANQKVDLAHQCDTAEGSSGSPVLDTSGLVVAIHHWGYGGAGFSDLNRAIGLTSEVRNLISSLSAEN
ncbi:trypsin-like serine peptidase [Variovorax boronicumulans]